MNKWYVVFEAKDQNGNYSRFGVECENKKKAQQSEAVIHSKYKVNYSRVCCYPNKTGLIMIDLT